MCSFYNICGGCHYQHIRYEKQVEIKEAIIIDCLKRIGKLEVKLSEPLINSPFYYRYKAVFKKNAGYVGFYKENTRDIVDISVCHIVKKEIIYAKDLAKKILKDSADAELEIVCGLNTVISIKSRELGIKSYSIDKDSLIPLQDENQFAELKLANLIYRVFPFSFFQSNWLLNNKVVAYVLKEINFDGKDVIDIYSGAGNFSLPIALIANSVIAYEENIRTVQSGILNAKLNSIKCCKFIHSKAEAINIDKIPDVVIINPPRSGITNKAMGNIIKLNAKEIVYMSCYPSTMARDMAKLKNNYHIDSLRLIDFFPQTFHIETLAIMKRK